MISLRQRMTQDMRIRNYSPRTIDTYIRAVAKFAEHFGKSPQVLGAEHIREYQIYLVETKKASWSLFNQAVCALRFLYNVTLDRKEMVEHIPFSRRDRKLPEVLSSQELARFFEHIANLKHRTVLMTMYGTGLRISEALNLRVRDVDSEREVLRVRHGKGGKDRYVPLSPKHVELLRTYWTACRPQEWLFPGESQKRPMDPSAVQKACAWARQKARLEKPVTTHTMRHCFATHSLEAGTDLRTIHHILGHGNLNTTAIYLHVATQAKRQAQGAADLLGSVLQSQPAS